MRVVLLADEPTADAWIMNDLVRYDEEEVWIAVYFQDQGFTIPGVYVQVDSDKLKLWGYYGKGTAYAMYATQVLENRYRKTLGKLKDGSDVSVFEHSDFLEMDIIVKAVKLNDHLWQRRLFGNDLSVVTTEQLVRILLQTPKKNIWFS